MTNKQHNRPVDSWLNGLEAALRRAGLKAKQEAERLGTPYVVADSVAGKPVFNRTVTLRDARQK